jgi:SAM-dependent methyltransferase
MPDVWGRIYRDQWEGDPHPHLVERDDGHEHWIDDAALYFTAPRLEAEERAFRGLVGPALDLGCGPGSYAAYLQNHGLTVTAVDSSPLAVKIAGMQGCLDSRVMDLRQLDLDDGTFASIVVMGNTFGAYMTPETLPAHMEQLRKLVPDGGVLLTTTVDPLDTDEPVHLLYHERNRDRGRPPGLVRIRLSYREEQTDWFDLWLTTREEIEPIAAAAGWELENEDAEGPWRVRRFRAAPPSV